LRGRWQAGILVEKGGVSVGTDRWGNATVERGKPRVYIQQYLDLRLPEDRYKQIVKDLGLEKPFDEDTALRVMEEYLEDLDDGSQCDTVHVQRGDGLVVLMTVVSYSYRQETLDRLMAAHMAKKLST
jgi:tRNA(His) 5'-end guanylyltransferase